MLIFGSLFAGIGGIDLGLERCGMVCKWQVEIDDYARRVLAKRWPDVRRHDDIRTWPTEDAERVDLIAGGFPCQDISFAGKGAGIHGKQSGLFFELARVVREMEPRYVLLENVAAILAPGRGMGEVLGTLATLGYDAEWHVLSAAATGKNHLRARVFILAYPDPRNEFHATSMEFDWWKRRAEITYQARTHVVGRSQTEQESPVPRVANGVPYQLDRLRGLGNAVVPQVAELVGRMILNHEEQSCSSQSE